MKKKIKLLTDGKFTTNNLCTFEFTSSSFVVKDQNQRTIARGHKKGQLCTLNGNYQDTFSTINKLHQFGINNLNIRI